ncbi:MAG: class I SAM-dependent methyltransferase [Pirellulales bacterium]|nr:class I SAM-dependent methyltransferase [Pirellulales bacterium]
MTATKAAHAAPSYLATRARFSAAATARRYPDRWRPTARDRREQACILQGLSRVPRGARVLDMPCGSGRLLELLTKRGFDVIAADFSLPMLHRAAATDRTLDEAQPRAFGPRLLAADALALPFAGDAFDAVICNRLFHHFSESAARVGVLNELARVCRGTIVASFFHRSSMGAWRFWARHRLRGTTPSDRIPIAAQVFAADARAVGLRVDRFIHVARGISPQCYAVLRRP